MKIKSISWCLKQNKGIKLITPNSNLSNSYVKDADNSLEAMDINKGKWKIIVAYYSCYNMLYALLMKAGIKSEIHDCTISLMNLFGFEKNQIIFISNLKKKRINVQYYLKEERIDVRRIKSFVLVCKEKLLNLDESKINKIRGLVKND